MVLRLDPENDAEHVFAAGHLLKWYGYLIAGMETEVETDGRLARSNGTRQVLANLTRFEHRQIGVEDINVAVGSRRQDQALPVSGHSLDQKASQK